MQIILFSDIDSSQPTPSGETLSTEKAPLLKGKRVVVVEDEGVTQLQLRKILAREGLTVVGAAMSGPEGVAIVQREKPDLVLMDIRMPGEFDGLEAARRILSEKSVCVVMLTAFSDDGYRDRARQIGVCGYVTKPIDRDTLLPQVEAAYKSWTPQ
jgi:CheY-like chemotaxis protein